tara:strand:+ start:481 stop:741 length:261 start_codon:yes stop_codon:yes gene_type:complete
MRTNNLDATAFRCLSQYSNIIFLYTKVFDKVDEHYDYHIHEFLDELNNFETLKEIREKFKERMAYINDRIVKRLDEQRNVIIPKMI